MTYKDNMSEEDRKLFHETVGRVIPIKHQHAELSVAKVKPKLIKQPAELFLPEADLNTPEKSITGIETLFFSRPGLQQSNLRKLKNGGYPYEATLDLHGHTVKEASIALQIFLSNAQQNEYKCVLIIHGKSKEPEKKATLKTHLNHWLKQNSAILAFCSAKRNHGHTGALYVLLRRTNKREER